MNIDQLIQRVCDDGIASVKKHEKGARKRGGIKGFEMCRSVRNLADCENLIADMNKKDMKAYNDHNEGKITLDDYWEQRYATLQVEHLKKVLDVAYNRPNQYASGVQEYARIVGVKGE